VQALEAKGEEDHLVIFGKSPKRRNRRSGFVEGISEVPTVVRSQRSCTRFKP
jgi:hypothetical protein